MASWQTTDKITNAQYVKIFTSLIHSSHSDLILFPNYEKFAPQLEKNFSPVRAQNFHSEPFIMQQLPFCFFCKLFS